MALRLLSRRARMHQGTSFSRICTQKIGQNTYFTKETLQKHWQILTFLQSVIVILKPLDSAVCVCVGGVGNHKLMFKKCGAPPSLHARPGEGASREPAKSRRFLAQ